MSDMLLEVDEALRAQQIKALWDKFGQWLIGAAVLVVLATAIGVTWHNYTNGKLEAQSNELLSLLQNEAGQTDMPKQLAELSAKSNFPLKGVMELYQAQKLEQAKDLAAAQKIYGEVYQQGRMPDILRDLARLHFVRLGMVQNAKAEDLLPVIEPLTNDKASFKASAMEMKAMLLLQQGKTKEADAIFATLSLDETVPPSIRSRAKSMMHGEGK